MILVDANVLTYAFVRDYGEHEAAREWLDLRLSGRDRVGLPWASLLAFARLVTNPRLFPAPATLDQAWSQIESWLSAPTAWTPTPTTEHRHLVGRLLGTPGLRSNDLPDVHLAALALGHGLEVASHDRGFARFDGLRWFDPLA